MFIYFAQPIDQAMGEAPWVHGIKSRLFIAGVGIFSPSNAFAANAADPSHAEYIDQLNRLAQYQADATVAILPKGVPTLGTVAEISHSLILNKPTLVFTDIVASVQLHAWAMDGAIIVNVEGDDFSQPDANELLDLLQFPPRPSEVTESEQVIPPLLVRAEGAANASAGAYAGDAGVDLAILDDVRLEPGEYKLVPTGVFAAVPEGHFGWITGRSSTWTKFRVDVRTGIIDAGYRGELMLGLHNTNTDRRMNFGRGLRLGQLIVMPAFGGGIATVDELPEAHRGTNGFGSSDGTDPDSTVILPSTSFLLGPVA